jgi:hypothetical protein
VFFRGADGGERAGQRLFGDRVRVGSEATAPQVIAVDPKVGACGARDEGYGRTVGVGPGGGGACRPVRVVGPRRGTFGGSRRLSRSGETLADSQS